MVPVVLALPLEELLHRLGHAPALNEAESGEDGARGADAEVVDQLLAQVSFRRRVDDERALTREADHAVLGVELHQFANAEIFDAHGTLLPFDQILDHYDGDRKRYDGDRKRSFDQSCWSYCT